jgi:hypothetical protein
MSPVRAAPQPVHAVLRGSSIGDAQTRHEAPDHGRRAGRAEQKNLHLGTAEVDQKTVI